MALTWTIDSTDVSSQIRYRDWALSECAERGQVGASTFTLDDTTGAYVPPGQKAITVEESAAATTRLFTGYIAERQASRGTMGPGERQWKVTVEDVNVLIDDRIITDAMTGNRPQETDYERVTWLLGTAAAGPITAGVVPNTNTVTMDKIDYRGKRPRDVLEDCAQKSGKTFFVYRHGSGPLLYYDRSAGSSLTSAVSISDVASEVDNATVFGAYNVTYSLDPSRVYSKVRIRYKGGSTSATNAATAAAYRTREVYKRYMRVKTADRAAEQASKWLEQADDEARSLSLTVIVPQAYVNSIRAGERVSIKLTRYGISSPTYWRVTKRTVRQLSDAQYELDLTFREKIRSTRFDAGPDVSVDEESSNGTDDTATAVIDSDGLTITGGKISVTNGSGTVVIDGSTDIFSIVSTGTLTIPRTEMKGTTYRSVTLTTGLEYDPACLFFVKTPSPEGKGDWAQPTPELVLSASGVILRMIHGRARYAGGSGASAQTQVQVSRFTSRPPDGSVTVRYYVLKKQAL